MSPTGIDESWGFADPVKLKAAGVRVVSLYLSPDPSKNMTAAKVKAYHAVGIGVLFNWEAMPGAPLSGRVRGGTDATEAVRQANDIIAAVGTAPRNRPVVYFSCDTDVNATQFPVIDEYYRAAKSVCLPAKFGTGAYGEASLVTHLAHAGITDAEWQTLAWSSGVLSPDADFYQSSINDTLAGASVDFDRVIHPAQLGAWWPPSSPYDSPVNPQTLAQQGAPAMIAYRVGDIYYLLQAGAPVHKIHKDYAQNISVMVGRPIATVAVAMHERIVENQQRAAKGR